MQTHIQQIAESRINFLLALEYTQQTFYQQCIASQSVQGSAFNALAALSVPGIQAGIELLAKDQTNHIALLNSFFSLTNPPIPPTTLQYDFTVGGNLLDIATSYNSMLLMVQILEDTSVRCYKGMLQNFTVNSTLRSTYLSTLLGIHAIEARHTGWIRNVRRNLGSPLKPWITSTTELTAAGLPDNSTQGSLINPVYLSEDNVTQAQINLVGINGHKEIDLTAAAEAFDEVLSEGQVRLILRSIITRGLQ